MAEVHLIQMVASAMLLIFAFRRLNHLKLILVRKMQH